MIESKFQSTESQFRTASDMAQALQSKNEKLEGQLKIVSEQLELVQRSHD